MEEVGVGEIKEGKGKEKERLGCILKVVNNININSHTKPFIYFNRIYWIVYRVLDRYLICNEFRHTT